MDKINNFFMGTGHYVALQPSSKMVFFLYIRGLERV